MDTLPVPTNQYVAAVHAVAVGVRGGTVRIYPNTVDRTSWPAGPWDDEPDKVTWVDDVTGYDLMIRRGRLGALCGYVGLPPGHPLHGVHYGEEHPLLEGHDPEWPKAATMDSVLEVHGWVTFSGACGDSRPPGDGGICHEPLPGRPAHVYWVGFDAAHGLDVVPGLGVRIYAPGEAYRDLAYVAGECRHLARQLRSIEHLAIGAEVISDTAEPGESG